MHRCSTKWNQNVCALQVLKRPVQWLVLNALIGFRRISRILSHVSPSWAWALVLHFSQSDSCVAPRGPMAARPFVRPSTPQRSQHSRGSNIGES
jgi:hypothetical protein